MKFNTERRSYKRKAINSPCKFETMGRGALVSRIGSIFDIGNGGAGLFADHQLNEGEVLKLYFPASVPDIAVPVYAQIMWSQRSEGQYKAGLRFIG